mmetsp:Transcript_8461/g.21658  ORF Transcript_8461/g.21658 Transcript_8461/m.21658 type:complete len:211 (-) Transcript_8461:1189-1821(-)
MPTATERELRRSNVSGPVLVTHFVRHVRKIVQRRDLRSTNPLKELRSIGGLDSGVARACEHVAKSAVGIPHKVSASEDSLTPVHAFLERPSAAPKASESILVFVAPFLQRNHAVLVFRVNLAPSLRRSALGTTREPHLAVSGRRVHKVVTRALCGTRVSAALDVVTTAAERRPICGARAEVATTHAGDTIDGLSSGSQSCRIDKRIPCER